jgi:hypothetical protein
VAARPPNHLSDRPFRAAQAPVLRKGKPATCALASCCPSFSEYSFERFPTYSENLHKCLQAPGFREEDRTISPTLLVRRKQYLASIVLRGRSQLWQWEHLARAPCVEPACIMHEWHMHGCIYAWIRRPYERGDLLFQTSKLLARQGFCVTRDHFKAVLGRTKDHCRRGFPLLLLTLAKGRFNFVLSYTLSCSQKYTLALVFHHYIQLYRIYFLN